MNHIELGAWGENVACEHMISSGYDIICKNFKLKCGEIDIIGIKDEILVFVEVKTRRSTSYGIPCEAVDWRKRQRIIHAASSFQQIYKISFKEIRFDVIEVQCKEEEVKINHLEGAF